MATNGAGAHAAADQLEACFIEVGQKASHPDVQHDLYVASRCRAFARGHSPVEDDWVMSPVLIAGDLDSEELAMLDEEDLDSFEVSMRNLSDGSGPLFVGEAVECERCRSHMDRPQQARHVLWVGAGRAMVEFVFCDGCRDDLNYRFAGIRWIEPQV
jgi:hypothetical protein